MQITILLKPDLVAGLPKTIDLSSLRIAVIPLLFTQGINEMQTLVNKMGGSVLQDQINVKNLELLRQYFDGYVKYHCK